MELRQFDRGQTTTWNRTKNTMKKAANWVKKATTIGLVTAMPLLAPLMGGCKDDPDPCYSHNDSTVMLDQETDGRISRIDQLEKEPEDGKAMTAELADYFNEVNTLIGLPLPDRYAITHLKNKSCFDRLDAIAYAIFETNDIYVSYPVSLFGKRSEIPDDDGGYPQSTFGIGLSFHEYGHLLPGGYHLENEDPYSEQTESYRQMMAELTRFQAGLLGFAVFLNQENDTSDTIRYAFHIYQTRPGPYLWGDLNKVVGMAYQGEDYDYVLPNYPEENMFLLSRLLALDGDFQALRDEILDLRRSGTFQEFFEQTVQEFIDFYSQENYDSYYPPYLDIRGYYFYYDPLVDVNLALRLAFFQETLRHFGEETALAFFDAFSHYLQYPAQGFTYTPEGMNCIPRSTTSEIVTSPCEESDERCSGLEGDLFIDFAPEINYCCVSAEVVDGEARLAKWIAIGNGAHIYDANGEDIQVGGNLWDTIVHIEFTAMNEIGLDEPCRRLVEEEL